jgi:hypothetical protein
LVEEDLQQPITGIVQRLREVGRVGFEDVNIDTVAGL